MYGKEKIIDIIAIDDAIMGSTSITDENRRDSETIR